MRYKFFFIYKRKKARKLKGLLLVYNLLFDIY